MSQSVFGHLKEMLSGKRPIKVGVVTSRIGPLDYYGTMEIQGLQLGIEYATDGSWMGIFDTMRVTGGLGDREARHALGETAHGMVGIIKYSYLLPENPVNDWLTRRHQEQYGENPDLFTGGGFAAGIALVEALKRTGGEPDAEALIAVMEGWVSRDPREPLPSVPKTIRPCSRCTS
jgi:hypothetical protein